ncbi:MAG: fumarylacetoacetate hydrolase family protein, partial [Terriglobales bacterium]
PQSRQVEHEGELAVVIGKRCRGLGAGEPVAPYILGYTCLNDVTARDLQEGDKQWTRAKGFDTFCPLGPWIETAPQPGPRPWDGLQVETWVNGEGRQRGSTADFIFSLERILQEITAVMTLEPGDVIATGTPAGVGRLQPGDSVEVRIQGIGTLRSAVTG